MKIYLAEDVPVPQLDFKDNQDVLDLIVKRPKGLIPMLDEEGMVPKGSWEGFYSKFAKQYAGHNRVKMKNKTYELGIVHYAGEVYYDPSLFLIKNKDTLSQDLIEILSLSSHKFLADLFDEEHIREREENAQSFRATVALAAGMMASASDAKAKGGKRGSAAETGSTAKQTVGRKFSSQMEALIANLNATKPRYIRCIKPNQIKKPNVFVHNLTNEQLTYSGVFEAVIIMQNGYPFRLAHEDFLKTYHGLIKRSPLKQLYCDPDLFNKFAAHADKQGICDSMEKFKEFYTRHVNSQPQSGKRPPVDELPRDRCNLLIDLIAKDNGGVDVTKFYVGITKTFYRANEHRALRELRHSRLDRACVIVQRNARRYIARKLIRAILANESDAMAAIMQRALDRLQKISAILQDLNSRTTKACKITCKIHIVNIAADFADALQKEGYCSKRMQEIWASTMSEEEKYAQLFPLLEQAKSINFKATHKGKSLRLLWKENPVLVDNEEQIRVLGLKVKVQKQFNEGVNSKNELLLEGAMEALKELRQSKVVDSSFCKQFEKQADTIIQSAVHQFDEVLQVFQETLADGRCDVKRDTGSYDIFVSADPEPLKKVLAAGAKASSVSTSIKVQLLVRTCESLMELRAAAKKQEWQVLQDLVAEKWQKQEDTDVLDAMNKLVAGTELFVPPLIRTELLAEVKDLNIAAISCMLVPTFNYYLNTNAVPDIPCYNMKNFIDSTDFALEIERTKQYEDYFDTNLLNFVATMKEHLWLRNAVSSGNNGAVLEALTGVKLIAKTHPDYLNAAKFKRMFIALDKVLTNVIHEQWKGTPGKLRPADVKTDLLKAAMGTAQGIEVSGDTWKNLMLVIDNLLRLRLFVSVNNLEEGEKHILQAMALPVWMDMVIKSKEHETHFPSEVHKVMVAVEHEFVLFLQEIRHKKAINAIIKHYKEGTIPFDLEIPIRQTSDPQKMKDCIKLNQPQLIKSSTTDKLLEDCEAIAEMRSQLYKERWDDLANTIVPLCDRSDDFNDRHEACQEEYHALIARYRDHIVQLSLMNVLPIKEVPSSSGNACQLLGAIIAASEVRKLSENTSNTLVFAKALLCLRCLMRDGSWEPLSLLFCGNVPTEDLAHTLLNLEKHSNNLKDVKVVEKTVASLQNIETTESLEPIGVKVGRMDIPNLSVLETLSWIAKHCSIPKMCERELESIRQNSIDRRCRICLLLGAATGKCHGTIDHLNHRLIKIDALKSAIAFAEKNSTVWSAITKNWMSAATELLKLRDTIFKALTDQAMAGSINDNLHELLSIGDLERLLEQTEANYGTDEVRLVLNRLYDLTAFDELSKAVSFGGPRFDNGKFDGSRLQYDHIIERLENARLLKSRSDRLDRLFFYLELCINLRKAVLANEWELSESGRKQPTLDRTVITVKRCLTEYKQALKFFRTPAPGVPPQVLVDEFALVGREWDRKLLQQGFHRAYLAGTIHGRPLELELREVRVEQLDAAIKRIRAMEAESGEVDKNVQVYANAALELIEVRTQALAVHQHFKAHHNFNISVELEFRSNATAEGAMRTILEDVSFVPDAIQRAAQKIEGITLSPEHNLLQYANFEKAVRKMKSCLELPYGLPEAELLQEDLMERDFMVQVLKLLRSVPEMLQNNMKFSMLLSDLVQIMTSYHAKQKAHTDKRTVSVKPGRIFDILYNSTIFLVHFYRAKVKDNYDTFEREWRTDVNMANTPHMAIIIKNVDTASYSIQQLIRAASRLELHPVLINALSREADVVEDRVSGLEIENALKNPEYQAQGKIGHVVISDESIMYSAGVLARIASVSVKASNCAAVREMLEVMLSVRSNLKNGTVVEAIRTIRKHLQLGEGNVDIILKTLFDSKDRKVMPIIESEFKLLTTEACDQYWQLQAKEALLTGSVKGVRGAICAHDVDPRPLYRIILLSSSLRLKSKYSVHLLELCDEAMKMRILVSGIQVKGGSTVRERTQSVSGLEASEISSYVDNIIKCAEQTVEKISSFNWPIAFDDRLVDQITDQTAKIQSIVDYEVMAKQLDPLIKDFVIAESQLLLQHYQFVDVGRSLDHILDSQYIHMTAQGLTLSTMFNGLELAANQGNREKFLYFKTNEYWCSGTHKIAQGILNIMKAAANGSMSSEVNLQPGTPAFDKLLHHIYGFIKMYTDFKFNIDQKVGHKKRSFPPPILESMIHTIQKACLEHVLIRLLCRVSKSENIIIYEDDNGKILFNIKKVDEIPLFVNMASEDNKTNYNSYIQTVITTINKFSLFTIKGNKLKDFVIKLSIFRNFVSHKQWYNALQTTQSIEHIEGFNLYIKDFEYFKIHLHIIQSQRSLEHNILLCNLPNLATWSVHSNTHAMISKTGTHLEAFVRTIVDGSRPPLPKYKIFEELTEIAYRLLDLLSAVKRGRFVHSTDLMDTSNILAIARHIGDNIHVTYAEEDRSAEASSQESVFACMSNLTSILQRSSCIESYITELLHSELTKLEYELKIVQLEALSASTFKQISIAGTPGEIVVAANVADTLNVVVDFFDMYKEFIPVCYGLKQAQFTAKLLLRFCKAQRLGDINAFEQLFYVISHMEGQDELLLNLVVEPAGTSVKHLSPDELIMLEEDAYHASFAVPVQTFTTQFAHVPTEHASHNTASNVFKLLNPTATDDVFSINNASLHKFVLEQFSATSLKEVCRFRKEVTQIIPVLKQHILYELMYKQYLRALTDCPASGLPGELITANINASIAGSALTILKENDIHTSSDLCVLLFNSIESICDIRTGQINDDISMIEKGISIAKETTSLEGSAPEAASPNTPPAKVIRPFGGIRKQFISLNATETDLAEADLAQRRIIRMMKAALSSNGCPPLSAQYPFHIEDIQHEDLSNICSLCLTIFPTCLEAMQLHQSSLIILKIRKFITSAAYMDAINAIMELYSSEDNDFPTVAYNKDELFASWRVASITQAIEKTMFAFKEGCIRGSITQTVDPETVNKDFAQQALKLYRFIQNDWKDEHIQVLENTCEILFNMRTLFVERNFLTLYDLTLFLLNNSDGNTIKLANECRDEVQLAHIHSAYTNVTSAFTNALRGFNISGCFGSIDHQALRLVELEEAFELSKEIKVSHPHIDILKHSAELVYRIRKAQLYNRWIRMNVGNSTDASNVPAISQEALVEFNNRVQNTSKDIDDEISLSIVRAGDGSVSSAAWTNEHFDHFHKEVEYIEDLLESYDNIVSNVKVIDDSTSLEDDASSAGDLMSSDILAELELCHDELLYRQILYKVFGAIFSNGYQGMPGLIIEEDIDTQSLVDAIEHAKFFGYIANSNKCKGLLRDTKLLLDARTCRLAADFMQLNEVVSVAEDHNALVFQNRTQFIYRQKLGGTRSSVGSSAKTVVNDEELLEPVNAKVWDELKLLKYDALFNIVLCEFAEEMRKEETLTRRSSSLLDAHLADSIDFHERIYKIESLLDFTKNASMQFPSTELDRLIEAMQLGLQLRRFVRDERNKSPQMIIDQVAKVKKRDQKKGVTCYVSLLIFEVSKMSNVLDFPVLLDKIKYEIVHGQKYLDYPIGMIPYDKIDIRAMVTSYDAALPSLEIMGTDENHAFMKLAHAVIDLRRSLKEGDLSQAMHISITHEHILKSCDILDEEIRRLRVEMENHDAGKLISYGLKTGRYLDVIAIAKMRSIFYDEGAPVVDDSNDNESESTPNLPAPTGNVRASMIMPRAANARRRSSTSIAQYNEIHNTATGRPNVPQNRRVSQGIADMMAQFEHLYLDEIFETTSQAGSEQDHTSKPSGTSTLFIDVVKNSIYALKRAVAVTTRVSVKSESTLYYLNAAKIILELREAIVSNKWDNVQQLVVKPMDLPLVAMEEVNAVREGLFYQRCLETISGALMKGGIEATEKGPHDVDLRDVQYEHVVDVVGGLRTGGFQDDSVLIVIELAKRTIQFRRAFLLFAQSDLVLSENNSRGALAPLEVSKLGDEDDPLNEDEEVETAVESFRHFEERKLRTLFMSLGLLVEQHELTRQQSIVPAAAPAAKRNRMGTMLYNVNSFPAAGDAIVVANAKGEMKLKPSQYYWISDLVEAIVNIKQEIEVIEKVLEYRNIMFQMIQALQYLPLSLARYYTFIDGGEQEKEQVRTLGSSQIRLDAHLVHLSEQALCKDLLHEGSHIINTQGTVNDISDTAMQHSLAKALLKGDIYLLQQLQGVIALADQYQHKSSSQTMASMLTSLQCILRYRQLLNQYNPYPNATGDAVSAPSSSSPLEALTTWVNQTKALKASGRLSTAHGVEEIEAYLTVSQQCIFRHLQLTQSIRATRSLEVNLLAFDAHVHLQIDPLDVIIGEVEDFLSGAEDLSIGLRCALDSTAELLHARKMVQFHIARGGDTSGTQEVRKILQALHGQSNGTACDEVHLEADYLENWVMCASDLSMLYRQFVSAFPLTIRSNDSGTITERITRIALNEHQDEVDIDIDREVGVFKLLGDQLHNGLRRLEDVSIVVQDILSFVGDPASVANRIEAPAANRNDPTAHWCTLFQWRDILVAVGNKHWLPADPSAFVISQAVFDELDPLLKEAFPFNCQEEESVDNYNREDGWPSVLESLCHLDWHAINHPSTSNANGLYANSSVVKLIMLLRNHCLEVRLREDLIYYINKGAASLDSMGNIVISELYDRLLDSGLKEIDRMRKLAVRYGLRLQWSKDFQHWLTSGEFVHSLRQALIRPSTGNKHEIAADLLRARGFLPDRPILCAAADQEIVHVGDEIAVFEVYVRGAQGQQIICNVLEYLQSMQAIDEDTMTFILLPGNKAFGEQAPVINSTPTKATQYAQLPEHDLLLSMFRYMDQAMFRPMQSTFQEHLLLIMQAVKNMITSAKKGLDECVLKEAAVLLGLVQDDALSVQSTASSVPYSNTSGICALLEKAVPHLQRLFVDFANRQYAQFEALDRSYRQTALVKTRPLPGHGSFNLNMLLNSPGAVTSRTSTPVKKRLPSSPEAVSKLVQCLHEGKAEGFRIKFFDRIVEQLIIVICEVLYFLDNKVVQDVLTPRKPSQAIRSMMPSAPQSLPCETYHKLWVIFAEINQHEGFVVHRPHWVMVLLLIIHFFRSDPQDNQTVVVSNQMVSFLRDLGLSKYLQPRSGPAFGTLAVVKQVKGVEGFYPANSPSLLTLTEYLVLISRAAAKERAAGTADTMANTIQAAASSNNLWSSLAEEDDASYVDPDNSSIPAQHWLRYHIQRMHRRCKDSDCSEYDIGLPARSCGVLVILLKAIDKA